MGRASAAAAALSGDIDTSLQLHFNQFLFRARASLENYGPGKRGGGHLWHNGNQFPLPGLHPSAHFGSATLRAESALIAPDNSQPQ